MPPTGAKKRKSVLTKRVVIESDSEDSVEETNTTTITKVQSKNKKQPKTVRKKRQTKAEKTAAAIIADNEFSVNGSKSTTTKSTKVQRKSKTQSKAGKKRKSTTIYSDDENSAENASTSTPKVPLKYKCPVDKCTRSFSLTATLQQHYRRHDEGKRPFKCGRQNCDKRYAVKNDLFRHIQVDEHDPKPPEPLSLEDAKKYVIVLSDVLDREYQTLGIKRYCKGDVYGGADAPNVEVDDKDAIDFNSSRADDLPNAAPPILPFFQTIHQSISGHYVCPFWKCNHKSKTKFNLKEHYRVHCGREYRPYLCVFNKNTCRYASNQKSAVEMHIRVAHFGLPSNQNKRGKGKQAKKSSTKDTAFPAPTATLVIDASGNEVEVEESTDVAGENAKKTDLEVDVSRYVETITEWLTMEDELFARARIINDAPKGSKVVKPPPLSCPHADNGCTYTACTKIGILRHVHSAHKHEPEVVLVHE